MITFFTWFLNLIDRRWSCNGKKSCSSGRVTLNEWQRCWPCCRDSCCSERSLALFNPKAVLLRLPFLTDSLTSENQESLPIFRAVWKGVLPFRRWDQADPASCAFRLLIPGRKGTCTTLTENIYSNPRRWESDLRNDPPPPQSFSSGILFRRERSPQ